jgi:hypothetical protein
VVRPVGVDTVGGGHVPHTGQGTRIERHPGGHGEHHHRDSGGGQAGALTLRPVRGDRGRPAPPRLGHGADRRLLCPARGPQGAEHQRQEGGQGPQDEQRDHDPDHPRGGQQEDEHACIGHRDAQRTSAVQLEVGGAGAGGSTTGDDRNQIGQGADQHLGAEPSGQARGERLGQHVGVHPARSEECADTEDRDESGKPGHGRGHRPRGEVHRRLGPGGAHERSGQEAHGAGVHQEADAGQWPQPDQAAGYDQKDASQQHRQRAASRLLRTFGDAGAHMVGHSVTRVPSTVIPIQPSTLTATCATSTRSCHSSGSPCTMSTPKRAPSGSTAADAT